MKRRNALWMGILCLGLAAVYAGPTPGSQAANDRTLWVDASSMPITAGHITLTIGAMHRTNGVFTGDYKMSVTPYFFMNDSGALAITVPDTALAQLDKGQPMAVSGTATTSQKSHEVRQVSVIAKPLDTKHGQLTVRFTVGDKKMVFEPVYHVMAKAL